MTLEGSPWFLNWRALHVCAAAEWLKRDTFSLCFEHFKRALATLLLHTVRLPKHTVWKGSHIVSPAVHLNRKIAPAKPNCFSFELWVLLAFLSLCGHIGFEVVSLKHKQRTALLVVKHWYSQDTVLLVEYQQKRNSWFFWVFTAKQQRFSHYLQHRGNETEFTQMRINVVVYFLEVF